MMNYRLNGNKYQSGSVDDRNAGFLQFYSDKQAICFWRISRSTGNDRAVYARQDWDVGDRSRVFAPDRSHIFSAI